MATLETNEIPLNVEELKVLVESGHQVDLLLEYRLDDLEGGYYYVFVSYLNGKMKRQVYSHRNKPRRFKDVGRAIDWGKKSGLVSCEVKVDFSIYKIRPNNDRN